MQILLRLTVALGCVAAASACGSDSEDRDAPPVIVRVLVAPEEAAPGALVEAAVAAHDPEGKPLAYRWSVPDGWEVLGAADGPTVRVRAPAQGGEAAVAVIQVTDPAGGLATDVALLRCAAAGNGPAVAFRALLVEPNPVFPGGALAVASVAESADGASLEYRFTVADPEWTILPDGAAARVVAPLAYDRATTLSVSAEGATGGRGLARVLVSTDPWASPRIDALVVSSSVVAPGGTVQLAAPASSPHGLPLRTSWLIAGDGWTIVDRGPSAEAIAPLRAGVPATVVVTVTDAAGATASSSAGLSTADVAPTQASIDASATTLAPGSVATLVATPGAATRAPFAWRWRASDPSWTLSAAGDTAAVTAPLRYGAAATFTASVTDAAGLSDDAHVLLATSPYAPPRVSEVAAAPSVVTPGGTAQVAVSASSSAGLPLSYGWSVASEGWELFPSGASAAVAAPPRSSDATIVTVTVTDAAGASASSSTVLSTRDAVPVIREVVPAPVPVAPGGSVIVTAAADSPADLPVTYGWTVDSAEWTLAADGATATLRAPLRYDAVTAVTVTAADPFGEAATARVLVSTRPYTPPVVTSLIASPGTLAPGGAARLTVAATSAAGLPLSYTWSVSGGGWSIVPAGAEAVLSAPASPGESATVTVVVEDDAGASASALLGVATGT